MKETKTGFPTDDLQEISRKGCLLPMRVVNNDNQLVEVIICSEMGQFDKYTGLPSFLRLMSIKEGGENFSGHYRKMTPNELIKSCEKPLTISVNSEEFTLPEPVFELLLQTSIERDQYRDKLNQLQQ